MQISRTVVEGRYHQAFSITIDSVRQQSDGSAKPAHWQAPYQHRENPYMQSLLGKYTNHDAETQAVLRNLTPRPNEIKFECPAIY